MAALGSRPRQAPVDGHARASPRRAPSTAKEHEAAEVAELARGHGRPRHRGRARPRPWPAALLGPSSRAAKASRQRRPHPRPGPPAPSPAELAYARAELAVKIELEQLVVSILDDPSVSRVMRSPAPR